MVQQKRGQGDGPSKRDSSNMSFSKKDAAGRGDGRGQNGNRGGFRTDTAISNARSGNERVLMPWVPDSTDNTDGGLEVSSSGGGGGGGGGGWDQFAENERLFGLKTDYDESIYTTPINRTHPQYKERVAAAEKKAREIERSQPTTSHVAEERIMDHVGGSSNDQGGDEEEKYSGVRRQDFSAPASRGDNKYMPPAKRAPSGQVTVPGAPVDPAIISSQLRSSKKPAAAQAANKLPSTPEVPAPSKSDEGKQQPKTDTKTQPTETAKQQPDTKAVPAPAPSKSTEPTATSTPTLAADPKAADKPVRPAAASSRNATPQLKESGPSATSTVERDVLKEFKSFAEQQRNITEKARATKAKADKEIKLTELKRFADTFKLSTPVPTDLISIIAKDPLKQKEIQARAIQNAQEMARVKAETPTTTKDKGSPTAADSDAKPAENGAAPAAATEPKGASRTTPSAHAAPAANMPGRHAGSRQSYGNYHPQQQFRNDRASQHMSQQGRTGNLSQRLRNHEHNKMSQTPGPHPHMMPPELRPPTGPAATMDPGFNRRISAVHSHMGAKLNPNSHEFKPNVFATSFNPTSSHASAGSSPHSNVNQSEQQPTPTPAPSGQLIRRKTKSVDVTKCYILAHIKTIQPPQGRHWDDNDGLRPSYDTLPTWRQLQDESEKPDSTMHLTYKEYFERHPFSAASVATPNPTPSIPHHHHQMPFHLQQPGGHMMAPRQSPHIQPMQMHAPQHPHAPHGPFNPDDQRMMHSNSAQSFASPRMSHVSVAYPSGMPSPAQVPYNQPVPFVNPQQMNGQFRSFTGGPQYMPGQPGHVSSPMMMQPQFMHGQQMVGGPPMQMYPGMPQFVQQPGGGPPPVPNGYPSPGRPAAPMMAHQGSQQGQPMYGMSPNVQYQQPAFPPQPGGGQMNNGGRNYGPQNFGTSPQQQQQMHQYGPQHRGGNGGGGYGGGGKNFGGHAPQGPHQPHNVPTGPQGRTTTEAHEDAK